MSDRFTQSDDGDKAQTLGASQKVLPEADKLMKDYLKTVTGQKDCAWRILQPQSISANIYRSPGEISFKLKVIDKIPSNVAKDVMIELSGDPDYAEFMVENKQEVDGTEFAHFKEIETVAGKYQKQNEITPELLVLSLPSQYKVYFANALALYQKNQDEDGNYPSWKPIEKNNINQFLPTKTLAEGFKAAVNGSKTSYQELHNGIREFKAVIETYKNLK